MKHRLPLLLSAVLALVLAAAGTAYAFDCIRVSSSLRGLQQSTKSGNWLLFNFGSPAGVQSTFDNIDVQLIGEQAACFATEYAKSGEPKYFALGIGVAGANKENEHGSFGVLAWHNKNDKVLSDGRGIDHIEGPILNALFVAAKTCGVPIEEEEE